MKFSKVLQIVLMFYNLAVKHADKVADEAANEAVTEYAEANKPVIALNGSVLNIETPGAIALFNGGTLSLSTNNSSTA